MKYKYQCQTCKSYKTNNKQNFIRHSERTNPCKPFYGDFACPHCKKNFTRKFNVQRHEEKCLQNPKLIIQRLQAELEQIKAQIKAKFTNNNNNTPTQINNTPTQINNNSNNTTNSHNTNQS